MTKSAKRDAQLADDWQWLANTPQGQRIIADLMVWGNVYNPIEANDPIEMAREVGINNYAKRVASFLGYKHAPQDFSRRAADDLDVLYRMESSRSH